MKKGKRYKREAALVSFLSCALSAILGPITLAIGVFIVNRTEISWEDLSQMYRGILGYWFSIIVFGIICSVPTYIGTLYALTKRKEKIEKSGFDVSALTTGSISILLSLVALYLLIIVLLDGGFSSPSKLINQESLTLTFFFWVAYALPFVISLSTLMQRKLRAKSNSAQSDLQLDLN